MTNISKKCARFLTQFSLLQWKTFEKRIFTAFFDINYVIYKIRYIAATLPGNCKIEINTFNCVNEQTVKCVDFEFCYPEDFTSKQKCYWDPVGLYCRLNFDALYDDEASVSIKIIVRIKVSQC